MPSPDILRPTYTLAEIYGPGHVYCPRTSDKRNTWLPKNRAGMDGASGASLCIQGEMPLVCHRGSMTGPGLDLLRGAGLQVATNLVPFDSETDYLESLRSLAADGSRLVVQFLHAPEEIDPSRYWVDPGVLGYINNKANLGEFVSSEHVAKRRLLGSAEVGLLFGGTGEVGAPGEAGARVEAGSSPDVRPPFVLKAASDESSGGGVDVCICRRPEDLLEVDEAFRTAPSLLWEEYLDIRRNFCLSYVVWPDGRVEHVGDTEQVSDDTGEYKGNWLGAGAEAPPAAVAAGLEAASRGAARGYRGMVGIDVAETADGRILVFDLNFRLNGSSASVLLQESIAQRTGRTVSRFRPFKFEGGYSRLLDLVEAAVARGVFLPLSTFDPEAGGYPGTPAKVTGLVLGNSREEVEEASAELEAEGLS